MAFLKNEETAHGSTGRPVDGDEIANEVGDADEDAKTEQFYPERWSFLREGYTFCRVLVYLHMATLMLGVRPAVQLCLGTVTGVFVCVLVFVFVVQQEIGKKKEENKH